MLYVPVNNFQPCQTFSWIEPVLSNKINFLAQEHDIMPLNAFKVSKGAKILNRFNQVPPLTQDNNRKVTNSQLDTTNEREEVSPFSASDQKAHINRCAQRHSKHKAEKNIKDLQKKYRLGTVSKYFTGGLKLVSRRQPHP